VVGLVEAFKDGMFKFLFDALAENDCDLIIHTSSAENVLFY
jgi:hypothetical protein